jgi:hypothetical protein
MLWMVRRGRSALRALRLDRLWELPEDGTRDSSEITTQPKSSHDHGVLRYASLPKKKLSAIARSRHSVVKTTVKMYSEMPRTWGAGGGGEGVIFQARARALVQAGHLASVPKACAYDGLCCARLT